MATHAAVTGIYRYPVKGLTPEPLRRTSLAVGATLPADRVYAIENGPTGFDPAAPQYFPKQRFLMLMRNERLARLDARYDDASGVLAIRLDGREAARGDLKTPEGRKAIEAFFAAYAADELRGPPRVLHAPGHSFSDVAAKVVSIINLASVAAIETLVGQPVDPLRFRANLYVAGWPAWHEFDLVGQEIAIGPQARLKVTKRITRCAAIDVDPQTGMRDLGIPRILLQAFDHADCGVYAHVTAAGDIAVGDELRVLQTSDLFGRGDRA
jgi:MOSC domain-containing protein